MYWWVEACLTLACVCSLPDTQSQGKEGPTWSPHQQTLHHFGRNTRGISRGNPTASFQSTGSPAQLHLQCGTSQLLLSNKGQVWGDSISPWLLGICSLVDSEASGRQARSCPCKDCLFAGVTFILSNVLSVGPSPIGWQGLREQPITPLSPWGMVRGARVFARWI